MSIPRLCSLAAVVSVVAAVVALLLSAVAGVPEQLLVIGTILIATEIGWWATDGGNRHSGVPRSSG